MARVFAAVALSGDARTEAARTAAAIDTEGLARVPAENLHATVAFLGGREDLDEIVAAMRSAGAECAPADVLLGPIGGFPSGRRARVLWVAIVDPDGALAAAADCVRAALSAEPVGWQADRPFVPHVTVARARRGAPAVAVPSIDVAPVRFTISSVELMESTPQGGKAPRYQVLASLPFSRSSASAQAGVCP